MRPAALFVGLAAFAVLACPYESQPRPVAGRCEDDGECEGGTRCVHGECVSLCETDRDCGAGRGCVETADGEHVCLFVDGMGCGDGPPCPGSLQCDHDAGLCRELCPQGVCLGGRPCVDGFCVEPHSPDSDADSDDDA